MGTSDPSREGQGRQICLWVGQFFPSSAPSPLSSAGNQALHRGCAEMKPHGTRPAYLRMELAWDKRRNTRPLRERVLALDRSASAPPPGPHETHLTQGRTMNFRRHNRRIPPYSRTSGSLGRLLPKPVPSLDRIRNVASPQAGPKSTLFKLPLQNAPAFVVHVRFVVAPWTKKPTPGSKPQGSASAPT